MKILLSLITVGMVGLYFASLYFFFFITTVPLVIQIMMACVANIFFGIAGIVLLAGWREELEKKDETGR